MSARPSSEAQSQDGVREIAGKTHKFTQAEIDYESGYSRVSCLLCANLTTQAQCRAGSAYFPLEYEPVMLWLRCDKYRAIVNTRNP